jgi:hypothetical protein
MARVHPVAQILALWSAILPCCFADYCSLTVRVISPDLKRYPHVPVTVIEDTGRKLTSEQSQRDIHFCDLGIRPVRVEVGRPFCNYVVVENLRLHYGRPYLLKVLYDYEPCLRHDPPFWKTTCEGLVRVSDDLGRWVSNASVALSRHDQPVKNG